MIDCQKRLTYRLARLDVPDTAYVTPTFELALNHFDVGYDEMKGRGIEGETLINKTVFLLSFVLEGMMGAEFSNPQKTAFQYVIQLVISIPCGNINTFIDVLADGGQERYADDIVKLDENLHRFFTVDYPANDCKRSREAIRRKRNSLSLSPTFRLLFSVTKNKIDMLEELERQNLIIVDANKPILDDAASAFCGRMIDQCLNEHLFESMRDARNLIAAGRIDYYHHGPHGRLAAMKRTKYIARSKEN